MLLDFCAMLRIKRMNESKVAKNMLHKYCTAALSKFARQMLQQKNIVPGSLVIKGPQSLVMQK